MTTDVAVIPICTRTRAMDGLHIEEKEYIVQNTEEDAEESSFNINSFRKHAPAIENMPDNKDW